MAAFQDTRVQTEQTVMVRLFSEIERNPASTQRSLAQELGIALGLMNQYLKRCITKGWIRATQVSPKRISYFLTPEGFKEKSHMVASYLARSLTFFRDSREECEEALELCKSRNWKMVALLGAGDLADIASLVASGTGIKVDIISTFDDLEKYDAVLITDILNPQEVYDKLKPKLAHERILTLDVLHISRRLTK